MPAEATTDLSVLELSRFQDIARRVLAGDDTKAIATAHGLSPRQMRRYLADPRMRDIYEEISNKVLEDVDLAIKDDKLDMVIRHKALAMKGMGVMGDVLQAAQEHIESRRGEGGATAAHLEAAIKAARTAFDFSESKADGRRGGGSVHVSFNIGRENKQIIKMGIAEAGVDLSDLLPDAEVIDITPGPAGEEDKEEADAE